MSNLVGNPEDRFSHNEAHIISPISLAIYMQVCECSSPFLFSIYLIDLEEEISFKGSDGIKKER